MPHKTKTKTKEPASPPPDAALLRIPPELRNTIYHLVADDIDETSIIGRKLRDKTPWWSTMAKHPLSQTCRQLRQEFDPIHKRRAMTTGVDRYRLELEDFDLDAIRIFAKCAESMPRVFRGHLGRSVDRDGLRIRFNLTDDIFNSIHKLQKNWRELDSIFSSLQRAFSSSEYKLCYASCAEVNLNFKNRSMSSTQKKITPTQNLVGEATKELKRISNTVWQDFWIHRDNGESVNLLDELSSRLRRTHEDYFRNMRWDREERANKALENRLEKRLRLKLRDELKAELKAELRAEILDEQKEEAAAELERQIQEGLEGWSTGDVPEI